MTSTVFLSRIILRDKTKEMNKTLTPTLLPMLKPTPQDILLENEDQDYVGSNKQLSLLHGLSCDEKFEWLL